MATSTSLATFLIFNFLFYFFNFLFFFFLFYFLLLFFYSPPVLQLQNAQSDLTQMEDTVSLGNIHVQALCEHLDRIFLHGWVSMMGWQGPGPFHGRVATAMSDAWWGNLN